MPTLNEFSERLVEKLRNYERIHTRRMETSCLNEEASTRVNAELEQATKEYEQARKDWNEANKKAMTNPISTAQKETEAMRNLLESIQAAGRPHGTDHRGNHCECDCCQAWDAVNEFLKA